MAATTTIRVKSQTRDRLNALARQDAVSTPELLERLVEREEQSRLLNSMNHDFRSLRADAAEWAKFKSDTAAWDAAAADPDG